MIATDEQFNVICWNDSVSALLGIDRERMLSQPITEAVPPNRRKAFERLLRRTVDRDEPSQFEIRLPSVNGQTQDLMVNLCPIRCDDGRLLGVAAWIIDQTQRKSLADRLAKAEKMAALGTLAGGVAHHFNNILGGLATFVDFALTSGDPAAMKRALQMSAEAATRAAKITESLLDFAIEPAPRSDLADLTEVVLTFVHLTEGTLSKRNIELQLDLKPVPVLSVEARKIHRILGNLLSNAEDSMPDGGLLRISLERADNNIVLIFADTGCGIEPKNLPLVFQPFFTTKGLLAGGDRVNPGLGLSAVHGAVTDMGGAIKVESQLGRSTCFTITFPLTPDVKNQI